MLILRVNRALGIAKDQAKYYRPEAGKEQIVSLLPLASMAKSDEDLPSQEVDAVEVPILSRWVQGVIGMRKLLGKFCEDDQGATAIEYALIASIIAIGIIASLRQLTPEINDTFTDAADGLAAR